MIKLKDGPVAGTYATRRAPRFLRAVVSRAGKRDVLDLLDDEPRQGERVFVYRRIGEAGHVHVNMGGRNRGTGFYALADYEFMPDVDGEKLRGREEWRSWCLDASKGKDE